jgi:rhomboid protease GluP
VQTFAVHFSTGQPVQPDQPRTNTFGLRGKGQVRFDDEFLTFEAPDSDVSTRDKPPRFARADVGNVDYVAEKGLFIIRSLRSSDYVVFGATTPGDAEAIWALLPQQKTPEFIAEQERFETYSKTMKELGQRTPVTSALISLNLVLFVLMAISGVHIVDPEAGSLIPWGSNYGPYTWTGEPWRLLTSAFLHAGIVHITLNLFALYQGGNLAERLFGSGRYALIYLLSALSGSVVSSWHDPLRNSVGASGAIFGVFGALLVFFAMRREDFPLGLWKAIGLSTLMFCGYSLTVGAAHPDIDNAAHVGGLLGGVLSAFFLVRPFRIEERRPQPRRLVLTAVTVLIPCVLLAAALLNDARRDELRFRADFARFAQADENLATQLGELLDVAPNVRMNRHELARRLREDLLAPWRSKAAPLIEGKTLPDGSASLPKQVAARDYIRAKERSLALTAQAFESADLDARLAADEAGQALAVATQRLNETE